jgi:hypothetical protein
MGETWLIEFRWPEGPVCWAGMYKDALGWAPTPETALRFETAEVAGKMLANGYGPQAEWGYVVELGEVHAT